MTARRAPAAVATSSRSGVSPDVTIGTGIAGGGSRSYGDSRSVSGSTVVELGTPGRLVTSVASRASPSGRRRTTTTWSAPVPSARSSTIAPTMASTDTDLDRPCRIRAKFSASARPRASRLATALRCRNAASAARATAATGIQSRRSPDVSARKPVISPRMRKAPERSHHVRRMGRSSAGGRYGRGVPVCTCQKHAADRPSASSRARWYRSPGRDWYFRTTPPRPATPTRRRSPPRSDRSPARGPSPSLGPVHPGVGRADEIGRRPDVGVDRRDADRDADRDRPAAVRDERVPGELVGDPGRRRPRPPSASASGRITANSSPP